MDSAGFPDLEFHLPRWWPVAALSMLAFPLSLHRLLDVLPLARWPEAIGSTDGVQQAIFFYSALPRIAVSILAGAMLGLAGTLFQQVLRNPLAEPTTLGVSAGAQLALMTATLYAPWLLDFGREEIALAGAALATLLVFGLAWRSALSPILLILSGLMVSLFAGACGAVLTLFHHDYLQSVFIWSTGTLNQDDWREVFYLLPRLAGATALTAFLVRPLSITGLGDEGARSLGLSLRTIRLSALAVAVALSAFVVSAVGMISFIGLAAPALARLSGARRLRDQLVWSPLMGASLLWLTDQFVQLLADVMPEVATGTATALLGSPLLLWMLLRVKPTSAPSWTFGGTDITSRGVHPRLLLAAGVALLAALIWSALDFGRGPHGWNFGGTNELPFLLPRRWPRVTAALAAGAMLAVAGNLMQRLTGNAMASPEALGISSGASLGVIALIFVVPLPDEAMQLGAAGAGAFAVLMAMLLLGRRSAFLPDRMLLTGVAIGSAFSAIVALLMASGDPRMVSLLSWMAGSTYRVTGREAFVSAAIAVVILAILPLMVRWLDILPLGDVASRGLGVSLPRSRLALLLATSLLAGAATLIVGPVSFVGLMAPHMGRMMGMQRSLSQLFGAAVLGVLSWSRPTGSVAMSSFRTRSQRGSSRPSSARHISCGSREGRRLWRDASSRARMVTIAVSSLKGPKIAWRGCRKPAGAGDRELSILSGLWKHAERKAMTRDNPWKGQGSPRSTQGSARAAVRGSVHSRAQSLPLCPALHPRAR